MEKKIRIQKFSNDFVIQEDKLLMQDAEFNIGPKQKHEGPIRIEFSIFDSNDVERCIKYLGRLAGLMPLHTPKQKGKKAMPLASNSDREQYLSRIMEGINDGTIKDQKKLTSELRKNLFVFLDKDLLSSLDLLGKIPAELLAKPHQVMMQQMKEGKDPKADKYDPQLIFMVDILERKSKFVYVVLYGELKEKFKLDQHDNLKPARLDRKTFIKFPVYMREDEREKYRRELRIYMKDQDKEKSKFFLRWHPDVLAANPGMDTDIQP